MDDKVETVNCKHGWEYNLTGYFKSVTSDVREYKVLMLHRLCSTMLLGTLILLIIWLIKHFYFSVKLGM